MWNPFKRKYKSDWSPETTIDKMVKGQIERAKRVVLDEKDLQMVIAQKRKTVRMGDDPKNPVFRTDWLNSNSGDEK